MKRRHAGLPRFETRRNVNRPAVSRALGPSVRAFCGAPYSFFSLSLQLLRLICRLPPLSPNSRGSRAPAEDPVARPHNTAIRGRQPRFPPPGNQTPPRISRAPARPHPATIPHPTRASHAHVAPTAEAVGEDERVLAGLGDADGGGEGGGASDLDAGEVGGRAEAVEREGELDELGLERAGDVEVLELAEDVDPGVERGEEEAELGEVQLHGGLRVEGDAGDVELQHARVGEAELVQRDDALRVGPDCGLPDLGRRRGNQHHRGDEEEEGGQGGPPVRHGVQRRRGGHYVCPSSNLCALLSPLTPFPSTIDTKVSFLNLAIEVDNVFHHFKFFFFTLIID
jgi:hypothetical protein